jgi:hypothetical protein
MQKKKMLPTLCHYSRLANRRLTLSQLSLDPFFHQAL